MSFNVQNYEICKQITNDETLRGYLYEEKLSPVGGKIFQQDLAIILIFTNKKIQLIWGERFPS